MLNVSRITLIRVIIQTVKRDLYFCTLKRLFSELTRLLPSNEHVPGSTVHLGTRSSSKLPYVVQAGKFIVGTFPAANPLIRLFILRNLFIPD